MTFGEAIERYGFNAAVRLLGRKKVESAKSVPHASASVDKQIDDPQDS